MRYILCDTTDKAFQARIQEQKHKDAVFINATVPIAKCTGCFKCWLKNPGKCTFADQMQYIGKNLLTSSEIIILCESLYGGFSVPIKRIMDRVIPGVLPFFIKANGELHHAQRYATHPHMKVVFYNAQEMTEKEQEQAKNLIEATALNFHCTTHDVHFTNNLAEGWRVVNQ